MFTHEVTILRDHPHSLYKFSFNLVSFSFCLRTFCNICSMNLTVTRYFSYFFLMSEKYFIFTFEKFSLIEKSFLDWKISLQYLHHWFTVFCQWKIGRYPYHCFFLCIALFFFFLALWLLRFSPHHMS